MRTAVLVLSAGFVMTLAAGATNCLGQQMTIGNPFNTASNNFFERFGVNWSGNWRGMSFAYGGDSIAQPAFGGFQPGAGLTTGIGWSGPDWNFNLGLNFTQGARQTLVNQTPVVTLMNGQVGSVDDTSQTPFVISVVPVIGGMQGNVGMNNAMGPPAVNPMAVPAGNSRLREILQNQAPVPGPSGQDLNLGGDGPAADNGAAAVAGRLSAAQASSAGRPAPSVAEARRLHDQEQASGDEELQALMERARAAEDDGKPGVAKIYYQMVARRATGDLKTQALARLDAIGGTAKP